MSTRRLSHMTPKGLKASLFLPLLALTFAANEDRAAGS